MSTVVIGGGIIGIATAYYLSETTAVSEEAQIHIVDNSPKLFTSASGFAGGFVASDWFIGAVEPLGRLSFDLHQQLAKGNDGFKNWGYSRSTSLTLTEEVEGGLPVSGGDNWLFEGTSRALAAPNGEKNDDDPAAPYSKECDGPKWLWSTSKHKFLTMGEAGSCAQVDPRRLCSFLLQKCLQRGVKLHLSTKAVEVISGDDGTINSVKLNNSGQAYDVPCDRLVFTAGAWTGRVFESLFPSATVHLPIGSLAGYSLVVRSPKWGSDSLSDEWHAVFSGSDNEADFSAELFARSGGPSGVSEIYVAGLNLPDLPLPETANDGKVENTYVEKLKAKTSHMLDIDNIAMSEGDESQSGRSVPRPEELDVVRVGLCWRPTTDRGHAIIGRIDDQLLGGNLRTAHKGGVWVAAGHGPWGICLSLGTGKVMSEMLSGMPTSCDVSQLSV